MTTNWSALRNMLVDEPADALLKSRRELFRRTLALYRLRLRYADAFNAHEDGKAWLSAVTRVMGGKIGKSSEQRISAAYDFLVKESNPALESCTIEQHLDALCPWPAQKREAGLAEGVQ